MKIIACKNDLGNYQYCSELLLHKSYIKLQSNKFVKHTTFFCMVTFSIWLLHIEKGQVCHCEKNAVFMYFFCSSQLFQSLFILSATLRMPLRRDALIPICIIHSIRTRKTLCSFEERALRQSDKARRTLKSFGQKVTYSYSEVVQMHFAAEVVSRLVLPSKLIPAQKTRKENRLNFSYAILSAALLFTKGYHSRQLCMFNQADFYTLPDTTPKEFISPPGIKLRIVHLLGECVCNGDCML